MTHAMKQRPIQIRILIALFCIAICLPAHAVNKDLIQLQTQVQTLQDTVQQLQESINERLGVMKNLIDQTSESMTKINGSLDALNKSLQQQHTESNGKVDQVSGQIQQLNDAVDELKARMAKLSKQLDDVQTAQQNLNANPAAVQPGAAVAPTPITQAPPADMLYNNGLRDYNGAKYDLAAQEFSDYLKYYSTTDLAGNAQFYLADIEYRQKNFKAAIQDYDKVLEQYPGGNKTPAAQLKKGFALIELGQKDAGIIELRNLIRRYPTSIEGVQARDKLKTLGTTATASKPSAGR